MTTATRITQRELESYLWGAATLLRGTIDAGDYKQFIFPLLFYKRLCDVYDEETRAALDDSGGDEEFAAFPQNHRFQIPPEAHWREVRKVSTNVGRALARSFRAIENANSDQLFGIFGDAQWTNKERLPDSLLRDLIEHFSSLDLAIANLPEDELGVGYEYLIKKFADDSGHTAAEFYTNRTVVHLMTELLQPQPGESIYDPTCGTGGMLISAVAQLQRRGEEWRNVRLYGQERNLMTSSIARMNCFLHGVEEFRIERGDTLSEPKFVDGDRLMRFDVVLANPPYSIKQWDREAFSADPWGRNRFGTPPQGRADYAFWQHIIESMDPKTGRGAILFPHGVLFRQEEAEMRRALIEADLVEAVIGLGPNLFYNSPMESCVVICRARKPPERRGKVLLINAVNEVTRERAQSFLTEEHTQRIVSAYQGFEDIDGFARVASLDEIRARNGDLSIPLYVAPAANGASKGDDDLSGALAGWLESTQATRDSLAKIDPGLGHETSLDGLKVLAHSAPFDRTDWKRVRFGDVVRNSNESERDPESAGIDRFIGLEHLEPGSLHVREWGDISDGTTFTRRCRPGQVLFGKRRAYQRKIAVAEFDAVVSGDIYVFEPADERLLPELLPFICLSDRFFEFAVETSAGSLSPRTNWKHLATFEFDLPPLDVQRRLAELLWAVDTSIQRWLRVGEASARRLAAVVETTIGDLIGNAVSHPLGELIAEDRPICYGIVQPGNFVKDGVPFIRVQDMEHERIDPDSLARVSPAVSHEYRRSIVAPGDVLVSIVGTIGRVVVVPPELDGVNVARAVARLSPCSSMMPEFLALVLRSRSSQQQLLGSSFETARKTLNLIELKKLPVPVPPLSQQQAILDATAREERVVAAARMQSLTLSRLQAVLGDALSSRGVE